MNISIKKHLNLYIYISISLILILFRIYLLINVSNSPYWGFIPTIDYDLQIIPNFTCEDSLLDESRRAKIEYIDPNGPAAKANIKNDDILLSFAGLEICSENANDWDWYIKKNDIVEIGDSVSIRINRGGNIFDKKIYIEQTNIFDLYTILKLIIFGIYIISGLFIIIRFGESNSIIHHLSYIFLLSAILFSKIIYPIEMLNMSDFVRKIIYHLSIFVFPLLIHFSLIYPEEKYKIKKYPILTKMTIYLPFLMVLLFDIFSEFKIYYFQNGFVQNNYNMNDLRVKLGILLFIMIEGRILFSYFGNISKTDKSSLRWFLIGINIGILPKIYIEYYQSFFPIFNHLLMDLISASHIFITELPLLLIPVFIFKSLIVKYSKRIN